MSPRDRERKVEGYPTFSATKVRPDRNFRMHLERRREKERKRAMEGKYPTFSITKTVEPGRTQNTDRQS